MKRLVAAALAAVFVIGFAGALSAQQPPRRALVKVTDNLYRFQNNFHFGVVFVTPGGVVIGDTIDAEASKWLKEEVARQFNQPIKYVFLSHDHADHASGSEVFADTAQIIAHDRAREVIVDKKRPTAPPHVTFSDKLTIHIGGKTVEAAFVGRNHSDNSLVLRFPSERALWAVDFIPVKSLAFREMDESYFPDWNESLKRVEAMDFDILLPGHGPVGAKADVAAFRGYLEDLQAAVSAGIRAGKTVDQLKEEIKLEKYAAWGQYKDYLPLNVQGMHGYLTKR